jgi:hypothetical protein
MISCLVGTGIEAGKEGGISLTNGEGIATRQQQMHVRVLHYMRTEKVQRAINKIGLTRRKTAARGRTK